MRRLRYLLMLLIAACAPVPDAEVSKSGPFDMLETRDSPTVKSFALAAAPPATRSNAEIARDFIDLEFRLESGRALPAFTRFDGEITVALQGDVPPTAAADLQNLMFRLQAEAGIAIGPAKQDGLASITIEFLPRARLQAMVPAAACFVAPRVSSWAEYRKARGKATLDWATLKGRDRLAIFVPSDTSPQEVRDCLHEELAQALGPLNDLYRLPDSVFNDDNFHTVLTGFDMLVLRAHYDQGLRNGMTKTEVAARLPAILARLNPAGEYAGSIIGTIGPRLWVTSIETALGPNTPDAARLKAAEIALSVAIDQQWSDNRLAFSHFVVGRLSLRSDVTRAMASFTRATEIYRTLPDAPIHVAHVDMQMAAFALSSGQPEMTIRLADQAIPVVRRAENAALLATFMLLKAEALDQLGLTAEADALRLDSFGWARYGFGSVEQVQSRMSDIAALSPSRFGG